MKLVGHAVEHQSITKIGSRKRIRNAFRDVQNRVNLSFFFDSSPIFGTLAWGGIGGIAAGVRFYRKLRPNLREPREACANFIVPLAAMGSVL
jgi:hypothetical protein